MATELVMTHEATGRFIGRLIAEGPVMGPRERRTQPGFVKFDWLTAPEQLTLSYTTTTIPPKKAFFPPRQPLFEFELSAPPPSPRCRRPRPSPSSACIRATSPP